MKPYSGPGGECGQEERAHLSCLTGTDPSAPELILQEGTSIVNRSSDSSLKDLGEFLKQFCFKKSWQLVKINTG